MMEVSRLDTIKQRYDNGAQFAELLIANYDFDERMRNAPSQIKLFLGGTMSIKFVKEPQPKGVQIPSAALKICGLQEEKKLDIYTLEKAAVVLLHTMSALELLRTVEHLNELGEELCEHLLRACGKCEECSEAL